MSDIEPIINSEDTDKVALPEPEYISGIAIHLLKDGQGTRLEPIVSDNYIRTATVDDIIMVLQHSILHLTSNIGASKVIQILQQQAQTSKLIPKGLGRGIH